MNIYDTKTAGMSTSLPIDFAAKGASRLAKMFLALACTLIIGRSSSAQTIEISTSYYIYATREMGDTLHVEYSPAFWQFSPENGTVASVSPSGRMFYLVDSTRVRTSQDKSKTTYTFFTKVPDLTFTLLQTRDSSIVRMKRGGILADFAGTSETYIYSSKTIPDPFSLLFGLK